MEWIAEDIGNGICDIVWDVMIVPEQPEQPIDNITDNAGNGSATVTDTMKTNKNEQLRGNENSINQWPERYARRCSPIPFFHLGERLHNRSVWI